MGTDYEFIEGHVGFDQGAAGSSAAPNVVTMVREPVTQAVSVARNRAGRGGARASSTVLGSRDVGARCHRSASWGTCRDAQTKQLSDHLAPDRKFEDSGAGQASCSTPSPSV